MANKLPRIEIRTRLHDSIDKNYGGGEWSVEETFTVGPRNIIKAADAVPKLRAYNARCYGNIGCGRTVAYLVDKDGEVDITAVLSSERGFYGKKTSKLDAKGLRDLAAVFEARRQRDIEEMDLNLDYRSFLS